MHRMSSAFSGVCERLLRDLPVRTLVKPVGTGRRYSGRRTAVAPAIARVGMKG
jgi:hypothetical protein